MADTRKNAFRISKKDIEYNRNKSISKINGVMTDNELTNSILKEQKTKTNQKEYSRLYYQTHKEKLKKYFLEYQKNNKEKMNKYQRDYRERNKEKLKEKSKKYSATRRIKKYDKYWEERMEKPINERAQHLILGACSGNKYIKKLRKKNLEYLYRKAPELKILEMSDDELVEYILKNEKI
jgi:hypothetical protein